LKSDVVELSSTFGKQIAELMLKHEKIAYLNDLCSNDISMILENSEAASSEQKGSSNNPNSFRLLFSKEDESLNEILGSIILPGLENNISDVFGDSSNRIEINKISDIKINKFKKKMDQQLTEFIEKINKEIEVKILENNYPVTSALYKLQDTAFLKLHCEPGKVDQILEEIGKLKTTLNDHIQKTNYDHLKDILN